MIDETILYNHFKKLGFMEESPGMLFIGIDDNTRLTYATGTIDGPFFGIVKTVKPKVVFKIAYLVNTDKFLLHLNLENANSEEFFLLNSITKEEKITDLTFIDIFGYSYDTFLCNSMELSKEEFSNIKDYKFFGNIEKYLNIIDDLESIYGL